MQLRIHRDMLAGLPGMIPGGVSVRDFDAVTGLGPAGSRKVLDALVAGGIGTRRDGGGGGDGGITIAANQAAAGAADAGGETTVPGGRGRDDAGGGPTYHFARGDRLRAAVALLEGGFPTDEVAPALDWRDFEGLAAAMLSAEGFAVMRNLVLTKPRAEIDVVGIRLGVAMLVDCKHWRRSSASALAAAAARQVGRTRRYVAATPGAIAVPVLVTLHRDGVDFVGNVPVVPISRFPSFVDEFYGNMGRMAAMGGRG